MRYSGPYYLAYVLIDASVDRYFIVLERAGERIESLEGRADGKFPEEQS